MDAFILSLLLLFAVSLAGQVGKEAEIGSVVDSSSGKFRYLKQEEGGSWERQMGFDVKKKTRLN